MDQISLAENQRYSANNNKQELYWTGTIVQLVEIGYPLREAKCINNGEISLKKMFDRLGEVFNFEISDYARTFMDIKNRRTDENTKFLDLLTRIEKQIIEEANQRPPRK